MPRAAVPESRWLRSLILLLVSAVFTVAIPGCGGCWSSDNSTAKKKEEEEKEKKEKEKKKKKKSEKPVEDFTIGRILVQPSEVIKDRPEINYVKRGHWVAAAHQMRANNFDVQAELRSLTSDLGGAPFDIEHTNYALLFSRPAPLPKGQAKMFESLFFIPRERVDSRPPSLRNELVPQRGGLQIQPESTPVQSLEEWQYLFLVVSSRPSAYNILEQTQTFSPAVDNFQGDQPIRYYTLLRPSVDKRVPLPSNSLAWTSVAVILWDDIDPGRLDINQQQAMLDWLHWGGHLLINGPNTLDRLKGSFLEPYLPATNKGSINLTQESFNEINKTWSLTTRKRPDQRRDLQLVKEIAGAELELAPHGEFIENTGKLVAGGRVGQGRIVVTAFSLSSGAVQAWPNFDGFLNGALLLRPAREFKQITDNNLAIGYISTWADPNLEKLRRDARLVCNLRYFARDMGFAPGDEKRHPYLDLRLTTGDPDFSSGTPGSQPMSTALEAGPAGDERFGGYLAVPRGGVASWNDFSGAVNVARKHLNDAAGVTIPKADFVAKVLGVYLLILVPVNWLIFRSMRRVEWAWAAAPVIAIIGAITVVRLAQLDIGFVRSRTEIDVVELQGGYSRAHVSRFIALYTSLATGYDLTFDDRTALAQPLAVSERYTRPPLTTASQVHFRQDSNLHLSGFKVASNSTGLVHAEQMHDMGGTLELLGDEATSWRIKNGTDLELRDVGILRRSSASGEYFAVYLPQLKPGATIPLNFQRQPKQYRWIEEWNNSQVMARVDENAAVTGELRLGRFAELAIMRLAMQPGEARLVAWSPKEIDGINYSPDAPQVSAVSLVLAHLRRGSLPKAEVDKNVLQDVSLNVPNLDQPLPDDSYPTPAPIPGVPVPPPATTQP